MEEIPLLGGNVGTVVRVGKTVRRTTGTWTPAVHELLTHLEAVDFAYSPRVLGLDDRGREILTYIDGETVGPSHPWPSWAWSDAALTQTAAIMREYHEAVAGFRPVGEQMWRFGSGSLARDEIVCHNDIAPYNIVWRDGRVVGIIDWDMAGPGTPSWDVACAAWTFTPLHTPEHARELGAPLDAGQRLRLLCDTYGLADRSPLLEVIGDRMDASILGIESWAARGEAAFVQMISDGHVARMVADRAELASQWRGWSAALTDR